LIDMINGCIVDVDKNDQNRDVRKRL